MTTSHYYQIAGSIAALIGVYLWFWAGRLFQAYKFKKDIEKYIESKKKEKPAVQALIDWIQSPEAQIQIGKQLIKGFEEIEDFESCKNVKKNIERLEKEILQKSKN